ncbi:PIG-L deacetylase family protein [Haloarchaeobius iranensis]|uniref:N-acetylglucosaminyl deacetylase, LmbE family n=1 Tax=Haloarchaeobius iranensis TaxID=996166 RepID=A0A1G9UX12_9EURY|nr:PIG-L deacetylase family protein [Haloarchaeobius iranensis]SDM64356.1 N-acetylglucosaminyl deacetylase, LmbE family [Haloarchaeobius iranensis]
MHLLAIVAHPDDAAIFCGGTLAKHADRGDRVTVAHMTRGEYGGLGSQSEAAVAETREAEARAAGEVLGVDDVTFLDFEDGRVTDSLANRLLLVDVLREHDPDLVLTHFRDDMHPDHRATAGLVTDAYYMASLPLCETDHPPCDPDNVYHFGKPTSSFEPETFVDVSDHLDRKLDALERHESQVEFLVEHGGIDAEFDNLAESLRAEGLVLGKQAGCTAAEGFVPLHETARDYLD